MKAFDQVYEYLRSRLIIICSEISDYLWNIVDGIGSVIAIFISVLSAVVEPAIRGLKNRNYMTYIGFARLLSLVAALFITNPVVLSVLSTLYVITTLLGIAYFTRTVNEQSKAYTLFAVIGVIALLPLINDLWLVLPFVSEIVNILLSISLVMFGFMMKATPTENDHVKTMISPFSKWFIGVSTALVIAVAFTVFGVYIPKESMDPKIYIFLMSKCSGFIASVYSMLGGFSTMFMIFYQPDPKEKGSSGRKEDDGMEGNNQAKKPVVDPVLTGVTVLSAAKLQEMMPSADELKKMGLSWDSNLLKVLKMSEKMRDDAEEDDTMISTNCPD